MGTYFTNPAAHPEDAGVQYLRRSVTFDSAELSSALGSPIGAAPAGSIIDNANVNIEIAFNAGTTNNLQIGSAAVPAGVAAAGTVVAGTVGWKPRLAAGAVVGAPLAVDTIIYAQYAQSGTAATAGKAEIVVPYYPKREGVGQAWPNN